MRRGSLSDGLRSAFSRVVRRARAFFGWREPEDEAVATATALLMGRQQEGEERPGKRGNGSDDGDGDSGSASPRRQEPDAEDLTEPGEARPAGYDEDGNLINYADDLTVRRAAERERMRRLFDEEDDEGKDDAEEERNLSAEKRAADDAKLQQRQSLLRIVLANRAAKARAERSREEKTAMVQDAIAGLEDDAAEPGKGDGPELG